MKRLQQTHHALGSDATLTLVLDDAADADALFAGLWQRIAAFEKRFSRFLPDSELSAVNHAAGQTATVSPAFRRLLLAAKAMGDKTGGLYNPFVLPALQRAGYVGSWPAPARGDARTNYKTRRVVGLDELRLGNDWVKFPALAALDFGGIGKGYLLDELGAWLTERLVRGYWLSLGGDILCGGSDLDGQPWRIGVQAALDPTQTVGFLASTPERPLAVATSGVTKRKGTNDNKPWHHLIDPRTGEPANTDLLTATVAAPTATEADVYAKCLVLLGSAKARIFAVQAGIQQAVFQTQDASGVTHVEKVGDIQ